MKAKRSDPFDAKHGREGTPSRRRKGIAADGGWASSRPNRTLEQVNAELQTTRVPPAEPLFPTRKTLPHDTPWWIPPDSVFFISINCNPRGKNHLAIEPAASDLLASAIFYHDRRRWFIYLMLLMPDHLHALASFPPDENPKYVIRAWKHFTASKLHGCWQRNSFEHRLRTEEQLTEKAEYIRQNPVRKGLTDDLEKWPFWIEFDPRDGTQTRSARTLQSAPSLDPRLSDGTECRPYLPPSAEHPRR